MAKKHWLMTILGAVVLVSVIFTGVVLRDQSSAQGDTVLPTLMVLPSLTAKSVETTSSTIAAVPSTTAVIADGAVPSATLIPTAVFALAAQPPPTLAAPSIIPVIPTAETVTLPVPQQPVADQIVLRFDPAASEQERAAYIQQLGGTISGSIDALGAVVVNVPAAVAAQPLPQAAIVQSTEPDYFVVALQESVVNDPLYAQQWALPVIGAPDAWDQLPANAAPVVVAVIDSGICADHPDLEGRILPGYDFVDDDSTAQDELGHGCGVAGVIAASANNGAGITGVAPNAQIMPLRVLNSQGVGTYSDVAAALIFAADNGAEIINLSLGGAFPSSVLEDAVDYAVARGVTVIAAAGNTGGSVLYPAAYAPVIAVASVDSDLQRSSFSSYGAEIDLLAPGRDILTTTNSSGYTTMTGTSFAAPHVAGGAVLELALGRSLVLDGGIVRVGSGDDVVIVPTESNEIGITETPQQAFTPQPSGSYQDQLGSFRFSYSDEWRLTSEKYWTNADPQTFDTFLELTTPNNEVITLRAWREVESMSIDNLSNRYLYPVLPSATESVGSGSIQGNQVLFVTEPGIEGQNPTVLYALFQCQSTVYRLQYIAFQNGSNMSAFTTLLSEFDCGQSGDTVLPQLLISFVNASGLTGQVNTQNCRGYYDPTYNRFTCGQCTWWAAYSRPDIPATESEWRYTGSGNANLWDNIAREHPDFGSALISDSPEVGSIAVWEANSAGAGSTGHVGYVVEVNSNGTFDVTDLNWSCPQDGACNPQRRNDIFDTTDISFIRAGVTLFENRDFGGSWIRLRTDVSDLNGVFPGASSVFIPAGWDALLFRNTNYNLSSWRKRLGVTSLNALNSSFWNLSLDNFSDSSNMNDRIRSIRISTLPADINRDNIVDLSDYSVLVTNFFKTSSDAGYNPYSDINGDGITDISDYSILVRDFFRTSAASLNDIEAAASTVVLRAIPEATTVTVGQEFDVQIEVVAGSQPVVGTQAFLNFDPKRLQIVSVTPGSTLTDILRNSYNNSNGRVDFAAGKQQVPATTGTFTLATIRFRALATTSATATTFNRVRPRESSAVFEGEALLGNVQNGQIKILSTVAAPVRNRYTTHTPLLTWSRVSWATAYEIQIDDHSNFSSPRHSITVASGSILSLTPPSLPNGTWYWRARARRSNGTWGPWSARDEFAVDAT